MTDLPHGVTATVERTSGADRYGNPLPPTEHTVTGALAPAGSTESTSGSGSAQIEWDEDFITDYNADLRAEDVLVIGGERFHVYGRPQRYKNPLTGWEAGTVARLRGARG